MRTPRPVALSSRRGLLLCAALWLTAAPACTSTQPNTGRLGGPSSAASSAQFIPPAIATRQVELLNRELTLQDGSVMQYQHGVIQVPVQRSIPGSRLIPVHFYRFPGPSDGAAPPIFRLKGGPGTTDTGELITQPGYSEFNVLPFTEAADLVVVGQRGFGPSGELTCGDREALTFEQAMNRTTRRNAEHSAVAACRQRLLANDSEIEGFTVSEMAADVIEIAQAIHEGPRIQLLGNSFGTHLGIALMRLYPDRIERALLGSLEGPDHTYDSPSGKWAALERIAAAAERSGKLGVAIPQDGFLAAFRAMVNSAQDNPISVEITIPDTDQRAKIELGPEDLVELPFLSGTNFSYRWPSWLASLQKVLSGDLVDETEELVRRRMNPRFALPAYYQLDCGSGISADRALRYRQDPAASWIGGSSYDVACDAWGADSGNGFRANFTTDIPTVLIQGDSDTSTPYSNAVELLPSFSNHHFVHVVGGSHGALVEAMSLSSFRLAMRHWLSTGNAERFPRLAAGENPRWRSLAP